MYVGVGKKSKPEKEELLCIRAQEMPTLKSSVQKSGGDYLAHLDLDSWKCFFQISTFVQGLDTGKRHRERLLDTWLSHVWYLLQIINQELL